MSFATSEKLLAFFKQFPTSFYSKNEVVFQAGANNETFYFVESGSVKMTKISPDGKNLVLHIFFPNTFFSLLTLVTDDTNDHDFITLENTKIRKVPKTELLNFLQQNSDEMFLLQLRLLKGMTGLLKRIEQRAWIPAYNQVASLLLYFGKHFAVPNPSHTSQHLKIKITHQEIADWLGLSRENVSLQMKQLEREGFIKVSQHYIEITNPPLLQKIVDLESLS